MAGRTLAVCLVMSWAFFVLANTEDQMMSNGGGQVVSPARARPVVNETPHTKSSRCKPCEVNGKQFKGHSRFSYEEGCNKYRCICRCDGTHECPPFYTIKMCPDTTSTGQSVKQSSSSSSSTETTKTSGSGESLSSFSSRTEHKQKSSSSSSSHGVEVKQNVHTLESSAESDRNRGVVVEEKLESVKTSHQQLKRREQHLGTKTCRSCFAGGIERRGNSYFDLVETCVKYQYCICRCNGSWNCPAKFAEKTCREQQVDSTTSTPSTRQEERHEESECSRCSVNDRSFQGGSDFGIRVGCVEYTRCNCHCNGSWECPDDGAKNVCLSTAVSTCPGCEVMLKKYPGNSHFSLEYGCTKFSNCLCHCNGTWECPTSGRSSTCGHGTAEGDTPEALVTKTNTRTEKSSSLTASHRSETEAKKPGCRACDVKGRTVQSNTFFNHTDGCISYTHCRCRCDGSWECEGRFAKSICSKENSKVETSESSSAEISHKQKNTMTEKSSSTQHGQSQCRMCSVKGRRVKGNSYFNHTDGCISYKNCMCKCDGSWACEGRFATNICNTETRKETSESTLAEADRNKCRFCSVKGRQVKGNSYFNHKDGCISYKNCLCKCDGSWQCESKFATNICSRGGAEKKVETSKSSASHISQTQGNVETRVESSEESSSSHHSRSKENTAREHNSGQSGRNQCQRCSVKGRQIKGNSYFDHTDGCVSYKNCLCKCDGSWQCESKFATNICSRGGAEKKVETSKSSASHISQTQGNVETRVESSEESSASHHSRSKENTAREHNSGQSGRNQCQRCSVKGRQIKGNSYFDHTDGCVSYKNCICRCDGSWSCRGKFATNTCHKGNTDSRVETSESSSTHAGRSQCRMCSVKGRQLKGNSYFNHTDGCVSYKNCICRCDGSWKCEAKYATNICKAERSRSQCRLCNAKGKIVKGNSYFNMTDGCYQYSNCLCKCDGSWNCKPQYATDICATRNTSQSNNGQTSTTSSGTGENIGRCTTCNVRGRVVPGKAHFNYTEGCSQYKHCLCRCDGTWDCPPQHFKDICKTTERLKERGPFGCLSCNAKGKIVRGRSRFTLIDGCTSFTDCQCNCDGSWKCFGNKSQNICLNNTRTSTGCLTCKSPDGKEHRANSPFKFVGECVEYNCNCHCNGSWSCPATQSRWACTDRCLTCDVDGRQLSANTTFQHKTGCLEYTCNCHCNGSWSCPGNTAKNTCPVGVNMNCNECIVSPREKYRGESNFVLKQDCLHYQCRCNCDGSYSCPGKDARNVCRGERLGGCRTCAVSESQHFRGDTDFSFRKGCINYQCRCNCDGSWNCPAKDARDVCVGEVPGGCRVCRVSEKEIYRANTRFDLRKGCVHYKCKCNCDGSWNCPGEDARDVCKGEVPGGCRSCKISENEYHPGRSNFEMVKNCIHYKCRCYCNGGYSCPGRTAKRVCRTSGETQIESTCQQCKISDREVFAGNSSFMLDRGCNRYQCACNCDGSWKCPAEKTQNICTRPRIANTINPARCRPCKVKKNIVPSESTFKLQRRCYMSDCECGCSGKWTCSSNRINTCKGGSQSRGNPSIRSGAVTTQQYEVKVSEATIPHQTNRGSSTLQTDIQSRREEHSGTSVTSHTDRRGQTSVFLDKRTPDRGQTSVFLDKRTPDRGQTSVFLDKRTPDRGQTSVFLDKRPPKRGQTSVFQDKRKSERGQTSVYLDKRTHGTSNRRQTSVFFDKRKHETSRNTDRRRHCIACNIGGTVKQPNELFEVDEGCIKRKNCLCLCDGRWECASVINVCQQAGNPERSVSTFRGPKTEKTFTKHAGGVNEDVSAWVSKNSQNNVKVVHGTDTGGKEYAVKVDTDYDTKIIPQRQGDRLQTLVKDFRSRDMAAESRKLKVDKHHGSSFPSSASSPISSSSSKSSAASPSFPTASSHSSASSSASASSSGSSSMASSFSSSSSSSSHAYSSASASASSSSGSPSFSSSHTSAHFSAKDQASAHNVKKPGLKGCTKCFSDGRFYSAGAHFDMRRGCVLYKCSCLCSGSYQCKVMSDNECSADSKQKSCSNCVYNGMTFPGSMNFTVREGCTQRMCNCSCDGTFDCHTTPIMGCVAGHISTALSAGSLFPATNPGIFPINMGYLIQTGAVINPCKTNCHGFKQTTAEKDTTKKAPSSSCTGCVVESRKHKGNSNFAIQKGCVYFDCVCDCGGSWKCSGKKSVDCGKQKGGEVAPGYQKCRNCLVQDTEYPSNSTFSLRQGCHEYNCSCNCDGSWLCPAQKPAYICPAKPQEKPEEEKFEPFSLKQSQPLMKPENEVKMAPRNHNPASESNAPQQICTECMLEGQKFIPDREFQVLRGKCNLYNCRCHCNGTYECPPSKMLDICSYPEYHSKHGENLQSMQETGLRDSGTPVRLGDVRSCKRCHMHGKHVEPLGMFVRQEGCTETLCHCKCDGTASCPDSASVNVCELGENNQKPMAERTGCTVGRRTHFTRVFALVQECHQRVCVCHDDGTWTCRNSPHDKKVC